jgi:hypothetical protein
VKLSPCLIVNKRFYGVSHSLFEARVLIEDEALREDRLASTWADIVLGHVADQKESEDLLEEFNLIVIKGWDQLSELLPSDTLATDIDVGEELVELLFSKFSPLRSWSTCWLFRWSC